MRVVCAAAAAVAAGVSLARAQGSEAAGRPPGRSPELRALLDEQVEFLHRVDPVSASRRGDHRRDGELPDASPAAVERDRAEVRDRLGRARALLEAHRGDWGDADRTDAGILVFDLSMAVEGAAFHGEQVPISTMGGPQLDLPQMGRSLHFSGPADYAAFAARLERRRR
jgi:hypothetical protein